MIIEHLDSYFTIARHHFVCEDYACTSVEPVPHILVCDGCSSSVNTDIGARLLAASATKALCEHFSDSMPENLPSYADFGYAIITRARHVAEVLGLNRDCLDATVLVGIPYHDSVCVYAYGDGCIISINRDGMLSVMQLSYHNNMPYYLSYWIDTPRRESYLANNQGGKGVVTLHAATDQQDARNQLDYDAPLLFPFESAATRLVALASDGVSSCYQAEQQLKIPVWDVAAELMRYKTTKGDFVKRRTHRMLKGYEQQGIVPTDDLAVATLLINCEEENTGRRGEN